MFASTLFTTRLLPQFVVDSLFGSKRCYMAPYLTKLQKVGVALALVCASEEKKEKKKRIWMKRWLKERIKLSHLNIMNLLDFGDLRNFLRIEKETF